MPWNLDLVQEFHLRMRILLILSIRILINFILNFWSDVGPTFARIK